MPASIQHHVCNNQGQKYGECHLQFAFVHALGQWRPSVVKQDTDQTDARKKAGQWRETQAAELWGRSVPVQPRRSRPWRWPLKSWPPRLVACPHRAAPEKARSWCLRWQPVCQPDRRDRAQAHGQGQPMSANNKHRGIRRAGPPIDQIGCAKRPGPAHRRASQSSALDPSRCGGRLRPPVGTTGNRTRPRLVSIVGVG